MRFPCPPQTSKGEHCRPETSSHHTTWYYWYSFKLPPGCLNTAKGNAQDGLCVLFPRQQMASPVYTELWIVMWVPNISTLSNFTYIYMDAYFVCVSVYMSIYVHAYRRACVVVRELVLPFYHVGPESGTHVIRLGSRHLYLWSHLPAPMLSLYHHNSLKK